MAWNWDGIGKETAANVRRYYGAADAETLLARIIELEVALTPIRIALSPVLTKSWRGTSVTSKLFPMRPDDRDDAFLVFDPEAKKTKTVSLTEAELASTDYYTEEGLTIEDGSLLADDFEIIAFHQSAPGCYIGNGSISVGDVRRIMSVLPTPPKEQ